MTAQEYLRQVQKLDAIIKRKIEERDRWMSAATRITPQMGGERVSGSGNQQKMADAVCEAVDIENELTGDINRLIKKRREIVALIEELPVESYEILYDVYIGDGSKRMTLQEYAASKHGSYQWATRLHRNALRQVQELLDIKERTFC